jgi:peptidyl-prolyl cis-trans isomerase D
LRDQLGDDYDEIATNQPVVRREHLDGIIDQLLLRQHAKEMGLEVSDGMLFRIISDIPNFQVDGQFNPELYRQLLRGGGRTPRSFEQELREDILTGLLPSSVSQSSIVTEAEIDRLIALQRERRHAHAVTVPYDDFVDEVVISDEDVEAYYEANQDRFLTTERVRIAYVELDARDLTDGLELSENELRRRYEAARERYLTPESRRAAHILIESNEERTADQARILAGELHQRLMDGEDFAELAMEYSDDPGSRDMGGDLGWIEPEDMVRTFEDELYDLGEPGDLSEPFETQFGWHIIRLDEIRPPEGMSFEDARDEILAEHIERESEVMYIEMSERLVDLVYADDSTLEPIAFDLGLEVRTSEVFSREGGEGIAANRRVIEEAFSDTVLLDGVVSDPIEIDHNRSVVIKLDEHFPAQPRPLAEVEEEIRERLLRERAANAARERARELLAQSGEHGEQLAEAAEQAGYEIDELEAVGRFDFQLGRDFISELFRLPQPGEHSTLHILPRGSDYVVVRLESVTPGDPTTAEEFERMGAVQQIRFARMNSEVEGLLEYLRDKTRIRVVEERL